MYYFILFGIRVIKFRFLIRIIGRIEMEKEKVMDGIVSCMKRNVLVFFMFSLKYICYLNKGDIERVIR